MFRANKNTHAPWRIRQKPCNALQKSCELNPIHESNSQSNMLEIISNTLKYLIQEHKQVDDDWEIPLNRIVMYPNDFYRCGSQGAVFLGRLSNSPVAVKRVRDEALADIRHLKDLNHRNIVKFFGVSRDPRRNYYYIVMEWCNNGTLAQKLHDAHPIIAPSNLCDFAQSIASGMKYLHSKNIIHRDLKPSNILLTRNYELKITDFGTHKVFGKSTVSSSSQTGTSPYMAPEVIRGESHSFPMDVWSYGIVLWEMFVGLRPYSNLNDTGILYAVGYNSYLLPIPSGFPEGLSFILKRCCNLKASERMTFQQICIMLKGATPELRKITKERWPPTQAGWKKEARDEMQRNLHFENGSQQDEAITESHDEAAGGQEQKVRDLHLKLQECSMLVLRDRREVAIREELVAKREQAIAKLETESSDRLNELNRLKELVHQITNELTQRGLVLECLQGQKQLQERNEEPLKQQEDSDTNIDHKRQDNLDDQKQTANAIDETGESVTTNL